MMLAMRTTLDLDDRVLAVGRAKAAADGVSLGRALSDLILDGLSRPPALPPGFPTFEPVPGHVITDEVVAEFRDDA